MVRMYAPWHPGFRFRRGAITRVFLGEAFAQGLRPILRERHSPLREATWAPRWLQFCVWAESPLQSSKAQNSRPCVNVFDENCAFPSSEPRPFQDTTGPGIGLETNRCELRRRRVYVGTLNPPWRGLNNESRTSGGRTRSGSLWPELDSFRLG